MLTSGALVVFHPKSAYFDFKKKYYISSTKSPVQISFPKQQNYRVLIVCIQRLNKPTDRNWKPPCYILGDEGPKRRTREEGVNGSP
jgi:hypothetical protein